MWETEFAAHPLNSTRLASGACIIVLDSHHHVQSLSYPGTLLQSGHAPCQRTTMAYHGITQPPAVWDDWAPLVGALATHLVERYTLAAVRTWRFEVWNELWGE